MLNLHSPIITNTLNNTIIEELSDEWIKHLLPEAKGALITGYYNAGILTMNISDFNQEDFYDQIIKNNYEQCCAELYYELKPIIQKCLRRMFTNFNNYLTEYEVILFIEGRDGDGFEPVKYPIKVI